MREDGGLESIRHDWRQQEKVIRPQFQEAQARRAGISREDLDNTLALNFSGRTVGLYRDGSQLLPIVARPPEDERLSADNLNDVQVWSPVYTTYIPITQVVSDFRTEWENALILRRDRKRTLTVQAEPDVLGDETADQVLRRIRPAIAELELPPGYSLAGAVSMKPRKMPRPRCSAACPWAICSCSSSPCCCLTPCASRW